MNRLNHPHVWCATWDAISNLQAVALLKESFPDVAMLPNQLIIEELRIIGSATLELLEDRTFSSVYRIAQTGVVFHIENMDGNVYEYDTYDDYRNDKPFDDMISNYADGIPDYTVVRVDEKTLFVTRNASPKFSGTWVGGNFQFANVEESLLGDGGVTNIAKMMRGVAVAVNIFEKNE